MLAGGSGANAARNADRIAGSCPAIVSPDALAIAARVLASNRWPPGKPATRQYLLRGVIRYADCGLFYCGSVSRVAAGEKRYYRCNGATQWRKLGRERCGARSLPADEIEHLVWQDVKQFIEAPEVAISALRPLRAPVDATLGEQLEGIERQLEDLRRKERNLLRAAAEAVALDVQALNDVLTEIRTSELSLNTYKDDLTHRLQLGQGLDQELFSVAARLSSLKDKIDQASFEERQRAVRRLVKGISVSTRLVDGQRSPHVSITYALHDLGLQDVSPFDLFTYIPNDTLRVAATTALRVASVVSAGNWKVGNASIGWLCAFAFDWVQTETLSNENPGREGGTPGARTGSCSRSTTPSRELIVGPESTRVN